MTSKKPFVFEYSSMELKASSGSGVKCEYHQMAGDDSTLATYSALSQYWSEEYEQYWNSEMGLCTDHLVAFIENFRDATKDAAEARAHYAFKEPEPVVRDRNHSHNVSGLGGFSSEADWVQCDTLRHCPSDCGCPPFGCTAIGLSGRMEALFGSLPFGTFLTCAEIGKHIDADSGAISARLFPLSPVSYVSLKPGLNNGLKGARKA